MTDPRALLGGAGGAGLAVTDVTSFIGPGAMRVGACSSSNGKRVDCPPALQRTGRVKGGT
jgi:hypothetical protein